MRRSCFQFLPASISIDGILAKDRRSLAKALTLVESSNPEHAADIGELLQKLYEHNGNRKPTRRIAISGSPGAGKSCFIEALGMHLVGLGLHVGVIAVDPSSVITGGSILGDKTRMDQLSMAEKAFVRPSPSRGHLGGVTARSWESMEIMEAANFDVILVETVGVGQSEIAAKGMTDVFILLTPPAAGDELQGIKKGIVEVADAVIVTKDDGDRRMMAGHTRAAYKRASQFRKDCHIKLPVMCVSSEEGRGLDEAWKTLDGIWQGRLESGMLDATRKEQKMKHFHSYFEHELLLRARHRVGAGETTRLEDAIVRGKLAPREAAEIALEMVLGNPKKKILNY